MKQNLVYFLLIIIIIITSFTYSFPGAFFPDKYLKYRVDYFSDSSCLTKTDDVGYMKVTPTYYYYTIPYNHECYNDVVDDHESKSIQVINDYSDVIIKYFDKTYCIGNIKKTIKYSPSICTKITDNIYAKIKKQDQFPQNELVYLEKTSSCAYTSFIAYYYQLNTCLSKTIYSMSSTPDNILNIKTYLHSNCTHLVSEQTISNLCTDDQSSKGVYWKYSNDWYKRDAYSCGITNSSKLVIFLVLLFVLK